MDSVSQVPCPFGALPNPLQCDVACSGCLWECLMDLGPPSQTLGYNFEPLGPTSLSRGLPTKNRLEPNRDYVYIYIYRCFYIYTYLCIGLGRLAQMPRRPLQNSSPPNPSNTNLSVMLEPMVFETPENY